MSSLTAPSKAAKTAQMMTENWLRNVFSNDLYTVRSEDGDHGPAVVVTHAPGRETEPPLLVVSVSDVAVSAGTAEEAGRYAAAGIRDFWVLEVGARKLHTFRDPRPDADAKHGYSYAQVRANSPYALVSPLAAEIHLAQVINLLPW